MILCCYLSRPIRPCGGLDVGDSVTAPLDESGDRPRQVLGVVAGGGKDCPLLSGDFYLVPLCLVEALIGMMML